MYTCTWQTMHPPSLQVYIQLAAQAQAPPLVLVVRPTSLVDVCSSACVQQQAPEAAAQCTVSELIQDTALLMLSRETHQRGGHADITWQREGTQMHDITWQHQLGCTLLPAATVLARVVITACKHRWTRAAVATASSTVTITQWWRQSNSGLLWPSASCPSCLLSEQMACI